MDTESFLLKRQDLQAHLAAQRRDDDAGIMRRVPGGPLLLWGGLALFLGTCLLPSPRRWMGRFLIDRVWKAGVRAFSWWAVGAAMKEWVLPQAMAWTGSSIRRAGNGSS